MELIESTFSGTPDRIKKDEEAKKQATEQSLRTGEGAEAYKGPMQVSKEASGSDPGQTKDVANGSFGKNHGGPPRKLPATSTGKAQESQFRTPVMPRKNVIPSRWPAADNTRGATHPGGDIIPPNNTQATTATPPNEVLSPETNRPQNLNGTRPGTPYQPAHTNIPDASGIYTPASTQATGLSTNRNQPAANAQRADLSSPANLPAPYHDTSAAEAAWQADNEVSKQDTHVLAATPQIRSNGAQPGNRQPPAKIERREATAAIDTHKMATPVTPRPPLSPLPAKPPSLSDVPTTPLPVIAPAKSLEPQKNTLTRKRALLLVALLAIILVNASAAGFNQFFGPQGWGSVWNGHDNGGPNLLNQIAQQLQHSPTPGKKGTATPPTPTQIVNLLMSNMTLDEKLGQMMMIQFAGQSYSPELDTMISQYHVGSVLYFQFNIGSKSQLTGLNAEMQHNANLPLLVAVDQEGGTVDRLTNLDGPQPSASQIGATNKPDVAYQQGIKDARDLASYGFNLNLAPVVDVNNVYNSQLYGRTYGSNPTIVSQMAEKYLEGLQNSGKVLGTLKHFPGLGDVSTDPHYGLPALTRDLSSLNAIDWAPYSNLIKQGHVDSIMVTHEIVDALDKTEPSSLSPQVIGILRNQMHFQGVIITDSLTMDSIHNFYTYGDAAAKAIEAGDDILMGADSPSTLAQMITGIKQAISSGAITQQHIDDSVRRILLFKYEMGLLHV